MNNFSRRKSVSLQDLRKLRDKRQKQTISFPMARKLLKNAFKTKKAYMSEPEVRFFFIYDFIMINTVFVLISALCA